MDKNNYYISEVAKIVGRHPNTIRNYVHRGLISKPEREWNGWRVFTNEHINQIKQLMVTN